MHDPMTAPGATEAVTPPRYIGHRPDTCCKRGYYDGGKGWWCCGEPRTTGATEAVTPEQRALSRASTLLHSAMEALVRAPQHSARDAAIGYMNNAQSIIRSLLPKEAGK